LAGCGVFLPGNVGGIAVGVPPEQYGERLCRDVDLEAYPACLSAVLDYFEEPRANPGPGETTSGPFAVAMDQGLYLGNYSSVPPFSASFYVSNGENACRGSYNAFTGSRDALFDVYCDDGRAGWADTVHDLSGSSGIGQLTLDDGTQGDIVFGYAPLGRARPYPYGDVWLPPSTAMR
jgi:hypothetical protein